MFAALPVLALAAVATVSGLVVPRKTPPPGWNFDLLEPYDQYHSRYLAIGCDEQHKTKFFDQCCHPLLATEKLETARPAICRPATTTAAAQATADPGDDGDDGDDSDCDSGDDEDETSTVPVHTTTKVTTKATTTHTATSTHKATTTHKPTSTTHTSPAHTGSTDSSSSVQTGGFATFYYQNGQAGACGEFHSDNELIAAIDGDRYGNLGAVSSLCNKKVQITNTENGKSVTVTIKDACPTCLNSNSIDLSVAAFKQIATLDQGQVSIDWHFV